VAKTADDSLLRIDLIVRPETGRGHAALTIIRPSR
jgi:general secretion pathway protein I